MFTYCADYRLPLVRTKIQYTEQTYTEFGLLTGKWDQSEIRLDDWGVCLLLTLSFTSHDVRICIYVSFVLRGVRARACTHTHIRTHTHTHTRIRRHANTHTHTNQRTRVMCDLRKLD